MARLKAFGKSSRNESGTLKQPRQTGPRPESDVSVKKVVVTAKSKTKAAATKLNTSKLVIQKAADKRKPKLAAAPSSGKRKAQAEEEEEEEAAEAAAAAPAVAAVSHKKAKGVHVPPTPRKTVLKHKQPHKERLARAAAIEEEDSDEDVAEEEDDAPQAAASALVEHEAEEAQDDEEDEDEEEDEKDAEDEEDVSTDDELPQAEVVGHDGTITKPRRRSYAFHKKQRLRRMQTLQSNGGLRFATEIGFKRLARRGFEVVASRDPSIDLSHIKITRAARATAQGAVESLMGTILTSAANLAFDGKTHTNPRIRASFVKAVAMIYLGNMPGGRFVNDLRAVCEASDADAKLDRQ